MKQVLVGETSLLCVPSGVALLACHVCPLKIGWSSIVLRLNTVYRFSFCPVCPGSVNISGMRVFQLHAGTRRTACSSAQILVWPVPGPGLTGSWSYQGCPSAVADWLHVHEVISWRASDKNTFEHVSRRLSRLFVFLECYCLHWKTEGSWKYKNVN